MADDAMDARYCAEAGLLCGSRQWLDAPWCGCAHCHEYKRTHQPTVAPPGVSCTCDPIVDYQVGEAHHRDHCALRQAAMGSTQVTTASHSSSMSASHSSSMSAQELNITFGYAYDSGGVVSSTAFQPDPRVGRRDKASNALRQAQERIRKLERALAPGDVTVGPGGRAIELDGWWEDE